jgi:class 3 adenylate cyclase
MKCPRCQHDNPASAKFCLECGARFTLTCPKCRSELPLSAKFCIECGERIAPAGYDAAGFASPESYTPKYLAERILNSKSSLEGERKLVTVLFADLKSSMELLADRDPEEARKLLDAVVERMMEAVHYYEGTVNEVRVDGIMALFGAPLAHEDHALRACYAALRMQQAVKCYAIEVRRSDGLLVQIRVGLNSGEVVVRSIGGDLRMDYSAVGRTTHLAARMEQIAAPGTIRLTADTLHLVEGFVEVTTLGLVSIKGPGDRSVRAAGGWRRPHPPRGCGAKGTYALCRPQHRDAAAPRRSWTGESRPRPGGRRGWGARRRQVAPDLGNHPLPSRPRLARPQGRLSLVWPGDLLFVLQN